MMEKSAFEFGETRVLEGNIMRERSGNGALYYKSWGKPFRFEGGGYTLKVSKVLAADDLKQTFVITEFNAEVIVHSKCCDDRVVTVVDEDELKRNPPRRPVPPPKKNVCFSCKNDVRLFEDLNSLSFKRVSASEFAPQGDDSILLTHHGYEGALLFQTFVEEVNAAITDVNNDWNKTDEFIEQYKARRAQWEEEIKSGEWALKGNR